MYATKIEEAVYNNIEYGNVTINLKEIMQKKNMSIYELSKRTGIKYHLLKKYYYQENYRVDLSNLAKICYILKCDATEIVKYNPPRDSK